MHDMSESDRARKNLQLAMVLLLSGRQREQIHVGLREGC